MGHLCDFCGEQRAMVYCRSDAASLCLSCDRNVHAANALSKRHSRTLLCERCNTQPASVRCVNENTSLCQNCDWTGHCGSALPTPHERQCINCYSGCPSAEELSRIWSFVLDESQQSGRGEEEEYACEQKMGLMSIDENCVSEQVDRDKGNADRFDAWAGSSSASMPARNPVQCSGKQVAGSADSMSTKQLPLGLRGLEFGEDDFYNDFNVADGDINFENYEELFGMCQNDPEQDIINGGIDSLFGVKNMSAADSGCQGGFLAEGSSAGKVKMTQSMYSDAVSADSAMSAKTEPAFCYSTRPAHSGVSVSFSGLTGESNAGDYQDSGVSSMVLLDEPPWFPPGPETAYPSASRDSAVMRYKEKKKARKFDKKIRYESRKARADVRKRVKGRFVKAGEAYDYDPMCQTRSC